MTATRDASGKFLPGQSGNPKGRKRAPSFRHVVIASIGEAEVDTDLLAVYRAMVNKALEGDVPAARLLLDRLTTSDPMQLELLGDPDAEVGPPMPPLADMHTGLKAMMKLLEEVTGNSDESTPSDAREGA